MSRRLLLAVGLLLFPALSHTQGRYDGVLQGPRGLLANQQIAVCTQPANVNTQPCSPLATLYTDATLTTACTGTLQVTPNNPGGAASSCSNPLLTDQFGNYHFYIASNVYTIQSFGPSVQTPYFQKDIPSGGNVLSGSPNTFTAANTFTKFNNDLWVDGVTYTTCAQAVTAAGTTNQTLIYIPSNHPAVDCPGAGPVGGASTGGLSNIVTVDHAPNQWCDPFYHSQTSPCSAINYNYDDGNTAVVELHETQVTTTHSNGAALGLYAKTWLQNATAPGVGGQIDGFSGEANQAGTLTGTFGRLLAHEADSTVYGTGGTITNLEGVEGYVSTNSALSACTPATTCTKVTNAFGGHFFGCRAIAGAIPTNCYGIKVEDQGNSASADNYSIFTVGKMLFGFSSAQNLSGFYMEDHTNARHQVLFNDSSDFINFLGTNAHGILFEDVNGVIQEVIDPNGAQFRTNPPYPFVAGGLDLGKAANPWANFWLGTAATNNFKFQPAATAQATTITIADPALTSVGLPLKIAS